MYYIYIIINRCCNVLDDLESSDTCGLQIMCGRSMSKVCSSLLYRYGYTECDWRFL